MRINYVRNSFSKTNIFSMSHSKFNEFKNNQKCNEMATEKLYGL